MPTVRNLTEGETFQLVLELERTHWMTNTAPGRTPFDLIAEKFGISVGEALTLTNRAHEAQRGLGKCTCCNGTGKVKIG